MVLRGQIDLWFEEAGELILVDYKTDRDTLRLRSICFTVATLRAGDRTLCREGCRIARCCYYLRSNRAIEVGISDSELAGAKAAVRAFRDAQESLMFPLRAGEQCRRCEFFGNRCPAPLS